VTAELHTDFPERFEKGGRFCAMGTDANRRELKLETSWPHKGQIVLKFAGIDSISDAETLVGCELQIRASARAKLEAGSAYVSDLIGCVIFHGEREIGRVRDIQFGAGEAPLLVVDGPKEYDIPFAEEFVKHVDVARKQIRMLLPEGMLEVNDPITPEEKVQQKKTCD
jgi:16S rRNA processing protein RimM